MNPKITIGKLRNRKSGKEYKEKDFRNGYEFEEIRKVNWKGKTYTVKKIDKRKKKPVPRKEGNTVMNPPIWKGRIQDAPITFYSYQEEDRVVNMSKVSAQLYEEWGEGVYQVIRYPDDKIPTISNLYEQHLITSESDRL